MDVVINVAGRAKMKPGGVICPHLSFEGTRSSCAVHGEPWFEKSPCHIYGNSFIDPDFFHRRGQPCRVGEVIHRAGGLLAVYPEVRQATFDELDDLGEWEV
jgi:hypothetical protein